MHCGMSCQDILSMIRNVIYLAQMALGSARKRSYYIGTYSKMKIFQTEKDLKLQMYSGMSCQDIPSMIINGIYLARRSPGRACKQSYHLCMYNKIKMSETDPDLKLQIYSDISYYQGILSMVRNVI